MLAHVIGAIAVGMGLLGLVRPTLLFRLRHPISVSPDAELTPAGSVLYRVGGVFSIGIGVWVMVAWGGRIGTGVPF